MFWLVHVADLGRPPRKSIDYLLRAVSRWQRVLNNCLSAIFQSLLTTYTIYCYMSLVLWRVFSLRRLIGKYNKCYKASVLDWWWCSSSLCSARIVLCLDGANERRRYIKRRLSLSGPMYVLNSTKNRTGNLNWMIYLMYDMTRDYMLITYC